MFVQLFRDKSYVRSQHLLLMHQSRRPGVCGGKNSFSNPAAINLQPKARDCVTGLRARKTGLDLHQSKKITPRTRIQLVAQSTAGRVPVIPAPGREHSDLQGHKGLAAPVPGFELPSPGAGHQRDPYTPALPVPLPACPLTCLLPCPSLYREAVGLRSRRFPVPIPALLPTNCVTLGRSFHLQGSSSTHIKVLSCACDPLHFQVTITRGSALWSPYHHGAREGSAFPVYRLGRRGHSHLLSTIKVRSGRHRPS